MLPNSQDDDCHRTPCETINGTDEWCGYTYTLFESGYQDIGPQARINAGDQLESHCMWSHASKQDTRGLLALIPPLTNLQDVYEDSTGNYTQYLSQNGKVIATLSTRMASHFPTLLPQQNLIRCPLPTR